MKINPAGAIGAVTREVRSLEYEGKPARAVIACRTYDAAAADVWDALTSAERIPRWFTPISGDLRLGGRYQLEGNAGGTITGCEPPRRLAVTWEYRSNVSWVTVTLTDDADGGTRLELEHVAHVDDQFWDQFGPGATGVGWDLAILGLGHYLATGAAIDRQLAATWHTTEEGKVFIRGSSDDWRRASVAAGTAAAAAEAAAARTTAFYLGESPPAG